MAQFAAIYVGFEINAVDKIDDFSDNVKKGGYLLTIRYNQDKPWVQLFIEEPENTPYIAQEISRIFPNAQVIGLAAYTVSDSVIYCEYRNGDLLRLLQSGFMQEGCWDKIEGQAQSWEAELLSSYKIELAQPGMHSLDIQKIGQYYDMPGFNGTDESWSKEIFN